MRKRIFIPIMAALGILLVLAGCAGAGGRTTVPLGQAVTLAPGQSADFSSENLRITFIGDVQDSRCPTGAT